MSSTLAKEQPASPPAGRLRLGGQAEPDGSLEAVHIRYRLPFLGDLDGSSGGQRPAGLPREVHELAPAGGEGPPRRLAGSTRGARLACS